VVIVQGVLGPVGRRRPDVLGALPGWGPVLQAMRERCLGFGELELALGAARAGFELARALALGVELGS
jgi:hypothetical protein